MVSVGYCRTVGHQGFSRVQRGDCIKVRFWGRNIAQVSKEYRKDRVHPSEVACAPRLERSGAEVCVLILDYVIWVKLK